jgi:hypothetical protein
VSATSPAAITVTLFVIATEPLVITPAGLPAPHKRD